MKAAIYARKSTDDNDRNAENKSVTRQVESARAYAAAKGWSVEDEYVFVDDGISGAEFQKRPGLLRMLNRLREFDVIVMSELSRLGREQSQIGQILADLAGHGVQVFFYLTDEELKYDTAIDKFLVNAVAFAAELEREKASQRSRDALERKARHGYNTGGRVYGYDNVPIYATNAEGQQVKSHTDYRINPQEADIVRRIFSLYADGHGHTKIAKTLNGDPRYAALSRKYFEGQTPPAPWKGTGSWAPSSIRELLYRHRYTGLVPFGEYRKKWKGRTQHRVRQDKFLQIKRKELRIIDQVLWERVQRRLQAVRQAYARATNGNLWGRPDAGRDSKYLLTGFLRCACCGSSMVATTSQSGPPGGRRRVHRYGCSYNSSRGHAICANSLRPRMDEIDNQVLAAIEETILTPGNARYVVEQALKQIVESRHQRPDDEAALRAEIARLQRELDRFMVLISEGQAPQSVKAQINQREARIKALESKLGEYQAPADLNELDLKRLERDLSARLLRFKDLIHANVSVARQALRKLLVGPAVLEPVDGGYTIRGNTCVGALFPSAREVLASPTGFEPVLPP